MNNKIFLKLYDYFLSLCETYGGSINAWAWRKRWGNRETGTGYKK